MHLAAVPIRQGEQNVGFCGVLRGSDDLHDDLSWSTVPLLAETKSS